MKLLIVRHADAGDPDAWVKGGKPDSERPLSDKGRKQSTRAAKSLIELVPTVDMVASSPYKRALETADLVFSPSVARTKFKITDSLVPEAEPEAFARWLKEQRPREVVAAVGHEPNLGILATWLVAGLDQSRFRLKKGGACLISFSKPPGKKGGVLHWLVGPKQLASR